MTDAPETPKTPEIEATETSDRESRPADESTLNRVANRFAKRAKKTQSNYDQNHNIFSK